EDVPDVLVRTKDVGFHDRLPNFLDQTWIRRVRGVIDENSLTPGSFDFVNDARAGRDDVHVVFATQSLLNNFHVQEPEKTAAKPESEGNRTFRRVNERRVVQPQLADGGFQMLEVAGVDRINSAENHRVNFLEPGQRVPRGIARVGNGVADFHIGSRFDVGDEITDIARI